MEIVKRYKDPSEDIIIAKYPNGKYYNHYGYKKKFQMGDAIAGGYDSLAEAQYMLQRHRPMAVACEEDKRNYVQKIFAQVLESENSDLLFEALFETLKTEIDNDGEKYESKGKYMLRAIAENNVNDLLIAICGWSAESLLRKAKIIHDCDLTFHEEIEEATICYTNADTDYLSLCNVNMLTFEVTCSDLPEHATDLLLTFDSEHYFKITVTDEAPINDVDFWCKKFS